MGGPPYTSPQKAARAAPATIVKVPTASAAHLAASEYFGLSSAMVLVSRRVDGVDADGICLHSSKLVVACVWLPLISIDRDGCRPSRNLNSTRKSPLERGTDRFSMGGALSSVLHAASTPVLGRLQL